MQQGPFNLTTRREHKLRFIDTHCHLDDDAFADDLDDVLDQSTSVGVSTWINVGYSPERWESTITLASRHKGVAVALGLHPNEADRWTPELGQQLAALLTQSGSRAVGEIGIDLFRGESNLEQQEQVFEAQLAIAVELGLPVVIHMRAAESQVLEMLMTVNVLPRLLFHSFEGSLALSEFVLETGSFVGVGGLATRATAVQVRDQLLHIPLNQMVLETDSPYLMPSRLRGQRNTPGNIPVIASFLADLLGSKIEHIANVTTGNAERFFGAMDSAHVPQQRG